MQIALFEPDIPQNVGSILRLSACLGVACHIIAPCGFVLDDRRLARVAMDYVDHAVMRRHSSWGAFEVFRKEQELRLLLMTTKASQSYYDFTYSPQDILLMGRESAGVPEAVAQAADARLRIPMVPDVRSLNIALAAAMALGEALRQTR